jgi:hypothetical protein
MTPMTALALTVALMSGGLLQERQPPPQMHLVDTATLEFVAGGLLRANSDLDVMSLQQLQVERARLEDARRSLVAPIVLLAIGGAAFITASVLVYIVPVSSLGAALGLVITGAVLYVAASVLVIVGTIVIISAIVNNAKNGSRLRRVEERISSFNTPPPPMGGDVPPPPPPMPAPASGWSVPQTDFVLAQF